MLVFNSRHSKLYNPIVKDFCPSQQSKFITFKGSNDFLEDLDRYEKHNQEIYKPILWKQRLSSWAKLASSIGLTVGASILGSAYISRFGGMIGGAVAAGCLSLSEQYFHQGRICDVGKILINTFIGAIPGGLGSTTTKVLEKLGIKVFQNTAQKTIAAVAFKGSVNGAIDGAAMGFAGGFIQKSYETGQSGTKPFRLSFVKWKDSLAEGKKRLLKGALGGAVIGMLASISIYSYKNTKDLGNATM